MELRNSLEGVSSETENIGENMVTAIVLIRGTFGTKPDIGHTLKLLKLTRINHCVTVADATKYQKMLEVVKDYATWGEISRETLTSLVESRGRLLGNKPIPKDMIKSVVDAIEKGEKPNIKPVFRLHPPRKGFKDKKMKYPQGDLGYRGEAIKDLLNRMI